MKKGLTSLAAYKTASLVGLIITGFIALSLLSAQRESLTYDEIVDIQEGKKIWLYRSFSEPYNPPLIRELQAIPLLLRPPKSNNIAPNQEAMPARLVTILFGASLIALVSATAYKFFGKTQALLSALLIALEPNTLGHSHYVTFDVGFSLFFFVYWLCLVRFWRRVSASNWLLLAWSLGLLLAAKVSGIAFALASLIGLLGVTKMPPTWKSFGRLTKYSFVTIVVALIVVWATYFFTASVIIKPRVDPNRFSERLLGYALERHNGFLAQVIYFARFQPVPLGDFVAIVKNNFIRQLASAQYFFLGNVYPEHRWYFFPVNIFLKTPLPLWFLLFVSIFLVDRKQSRKNIFIFLVPIIAIISVASVSSMSPWTRYVLPIYPFICLLAADAVGAFKSQKTQIVLAALLTWYGLGTIYYFPHFISYANEISGDRREHYRLFTDSNIDWGQSLPDLVAYVKVTNPRHVSLSYFGRDNGNAYGLISNRVWGSYKFEDICAFHEIDYSLSTGPRLSAISISNWYSCGYWSLSEFSQRRLLTVVGDSILIFR